MIGAFRTATLLLVVGCVWLVLSAWPNTPRVAFISPPSFVPEQEIVTYYVRVPRQAENRLLTVAAFDVGERVSYTERHLDGINSLAMWNIHWRLPVGELELVATLFNAQQQVGRDVHRVTVYSQ